jgi:colanic acid/amylovoran biosynthesis protein
MNESNPINILIINVHSTMNAGDAALLWLNIRQLEKVFPEGKFTALVNYPNEPFYISVPNLKVMPSPFALVEAGSELPGWNKIIKLAFGCLIILLGMILPNKYIKNIRSKWLQLTQIYRSSNVIAAVSGAQLVSLGRFSWPLIISSLPIILAHLFHKPLYIMPQSTGPFRWKWEKWLVREMYSRARLVFLRDPISMELMKEIGVSGGKVKFASDPGFTLPMISREQALIIMSGYSYIPNKHAMGMTVIAQLSQSFNKVMFDGYYRILANTMDRFAKEFEAKIYIFDQVTGPSERENDSSAAKILLSLLANDQNRIIHVDRKLDPMELKGCYSLMDMFIASRLHSGIFAMSSGVPTLFIGYNPKTRGVLKAAGLDEWMLDINCMDEKHFWELLRLTWENRNNISNKIQSVILSCQEDFDRVSGWIAQDYSNARKS